MLLFADDTALVADSKKLCRLVSEFGRVCESRKLRVNVSKSKIIWYSRYICKCGSNALQVIEAITGNYR